MLEACQEPPPSPRSRFCSWPRSPGSPGWVDEGTRRRLIGYGRSAPSCRWMARLRFAVSPTPTFANAATEAIEQDQGSVLDWSVRDGLVYAVSEQPGEDELVRVTVTEDQ